MWLINNLFNFVVKLSEFTISEIKLLVVMKLLLLASVLVLFEEGFLKDILKLIFLIVYFDKILLFQQKFF